MKIGLPQYSNVESVSNKGHPRMINYTLQDISGSLLAAIIFPIVLLIPGYVVGWLLNGFDFRSRHLMVQHIIGVVLSNAISPIVLFLLYRLTSANIALACLFIFAVVYIVLFIREIIKRAENPQIFSSIPIRYQRIAALIAGVALFFSIVLLVDIQVQDRLYFSNVSYDLTTRVSVVDAVTRTGVPPINPGYYPGHPVQLTFLYYFWYILGSVVDRLGGSHVSAYQSMIASTAWCGLTLISTLALYIHLRTNGSREKKYRLPVIAAQLLLVGGLDVIPVGMAIIQDKVLLGRLPYDGHLESWNTPIMTWGNALLWVPHHIASTLACITAMLLIISTRQGTLKQKSIAVILAGLAFASAVGLSMWIMFTFAIFWGVWLLFIMAKPDLRKMAAQLVVAGIFAIILSSPFLVGLTQSGQDTTQGLLPVALYVRPFMAIIFFEFLPRMAQLFVNFLFLPLNYLFEFGFFLIVAILWLRSTRETRRSGNPYQNAETILILTIIILLSFVHSNVIVINDLGIRGWIPLQFVLVVWAVDLLNGKSSQPKPSILSTIRSISDNKRLGNLLSIFFVIGIFSSLTDLTAARTWPILVDLNIVGFPNELSPDIRLGERTYAGRQTYDYIQTHVPDTLIIQNNPAINLERPSGLYGNHQMAISDRTAYGIPADEYQQMTEGIREIFDAQNVLDWNLLDQICNNYSIDAIVVGDTDPLWSSIDDLGRERPPIYKNNFYAVFTCGN